MTPQQIVGLAVRLFALWLVVVALRAIFYFASSIDGPVSLSGALAFYAYSAPILYLLLAVFLWLFPMSIAHQIVPRTHDTNALHLPAREATAAASAILGIWVLVSAVPQWFIAGAFFFLGGATHALDLVISDKRSLQLLATIPQCAFGLFLVAKPWFIASKVFPTEELSEG